MFSADIVVLFSMKSNRFNPGALFLLLVFSIQAIAPSMGGYLRLCIGCDQTGIAIGPRQAEFAPVSTDDCCSPPSTPLTGDESIKGGVLVERQVTACDCIGVELQLDNASYTIPTNSINELNGLAQLFALPAPLNTCTPKPQFRMVCQRGPPGISDSFAGQTLFGQRTSLAL